jgi:hypothetical protein
MHFHRYSKMSNNYLICIELTKERYDICISAFLQGGRKKEQEERETEQREKVLKL